MSSKISWHSKPASRKHLGGASASERRKTQIVVDKRRWTWYNIMGSGTTSTSPATGGQQMANRSKPNTKEINRHLNSKPPYPLKTGGGAGGAGRLEKAGLPVKGK